MKTLWPRIALCALGIALMLNVALGYVYRFVQPIYAWPIAISGAILLLLGLRMPVQSRPLPAVTWILLLPIVLATVAVPGPLTMDVKPRRVEVVAGETPDALPELVPFHDGVNDTTVLDMLQRQPSVGTQVRLVGMVRADADGWELVRYRMICCAADAVLYGVRIDAPVPKAEWVSVVGTVASTDPLRITAQSVTPVATPERPYL